VTRLFLALTARARALWQRALREHATPREVAFAVAVGAFAAFTPFLGFHIWIALGVASLLRLNRLWAVLASHVSPLPIFFAVSFLEIEAGHRLRAGAWIAMTVGDVATHGHNLLVDWLVGTVFVAGPIAATLGVVAYFAARRWQAVRPQSRGEAPPASSGSPPSAPRAPTP
jgi:uncharacterized protein (DUF2062 family)